MQLIDSKTFTGSTAKISFALPVGNYYRLYANFQSTLDTGQGANLVGSDFGNFSLREGLPGSRIRGDILDAYNRMKTRNTISMKDIDTDTLADWYFSFPLQLPYDNETVRIVENENTVFFEIEPASTMSTRLASNTATVQLWAQYLPSGIAPYRLRFNYADFSIVSGTRTHPLGYENVEAVYVEYDTTLTNVKWNRDGSIPFDADIESLVAHTLHNNPVEDFDSDAVATTLPFLELQGNPSQSLVGLLNENNSLVLDGSGTDTITVATMSVDFNTPEKLRQSINSKAATTQVILDRKRNASPPKSRPLEVIDILSSRGV